MTAAIALAEPTDAPDVARLVWLNASPDQQARQPLEAFTSDFAEWWSAHDTHLPFLARLDGPVGMTWLAVTPRVPRPGLLDRSSGDIQSVFVLPEYRGSGIGSALIRAALDHATTLGLAKVTVQSGRRATPVYERLGFTPSPQLLQTDLS